MTSSKPKYNCFTSSYQNKSAYSKLKQMYSLGAKLYILLWFFSTYLYYAEKIEGVIKTHGENYNLILLP